MCSVIKYVLLTIIIIVQFFGRGFSCRTQSGEKGKCGPLENCYGVYYPIIGQPRDSDRVIEYLSQYACIKNGKNSICCPKRFQPPPTPTYPYNPENHGHSEMFPYIGKYSLPVPNANRIIGGVVAPLNTFVFMALLQYNTSSGLQFMCGGSIINEHYILTAAHCVHTSDRLVSVRLGEHNIATELDCTDPMHIRKNEDIICSHPVQDIKIASIVPHREYDIPHMANDIALIRLQTPIDFSKNNVKPIYLPTTTQLQMKKPRNLIIAGWGITERNAPSNKLKAASIPVVPKSACENAFFGNTFVDWEICAGGETASGQPANNTCRGDSGGPAFDYELVNNSLHPIQFGIVSAGRMGCGENAISSPSIYTNVSYFIKWILDNMSP